MGQMTQPTMSQHWKTTVSHGQSYYTQYINNNRDLTMSVVWLAMVSALATAATPAELRRFSASVSARVDNIADNKFIRLHAVET